MNRFEKIFELKSGITVHAKRVIPGRNIYKKYKLIPINNSAFWVVGRQFNLNEFEFFLPQLYVALTYLTGPGDFSYDDYKGSYSFTFELSVKKNNVDSRYVYHMYHYRSYIEFSVYQIVSKEDPRESYVLCDPDEALFSDEDICYFSVFLCAYSLGYLEGTRYTPEPFLKYSDSNLFLFGYSKNKYFLEQYEDQSQYLKEKNLLQNEKMYKFDIEVPCR